METHELGRTMRRLPVNSMGVKLIIVGALALAMTIPALFVYGLISERTDRAEQVTEEVGSLVGGPQTFAGPMVAVPYGVPGIPGTATDRGIYVIAPAQSDVNVTTKVEVRHRSLFKVPVYQSQLVFKAFFDLTGVPANGPSGMVLDWEHAEFIVSASDARGALSDATLTTAGKTETLVPAATIDSLTIDPRKNGGTSQRFFGAQAGYIATPGAKFETTATLRFSGAKRLAILANGKTTTVSIKGDWPHPSFDGGFLPMKRTVSDQGFEANWSVPFIARGVHSEGGVDTLKDLGPTAMGVSFVELADPYQSVTRSLKYAPLFIGLVFLAYFVFEVTTEKRVHPAQYLLIGLAQIVFYLLLLSIAERIGFDFAFALAAIATVGLISTYAGWVFDNRKHGLLALVVFTFVYALIYVLMRLEDEALLIGALASFAAIACVMYFTRKIDWYGSAAGLSPSPGEGEAAARPADGD